MWDDLKFIGVAALAFVLIAISVITFVREGVAWDCATYGRATGLETKVQAMVCYVKGEDRWYAMDEWKLRGATRGR